MSVLILALAAASTQRALNVADRAYAVCVESQVRRIDNGRDKAADISESAIELCVSKQGPLWQAYYDLISENGSDWPRKETNEFMERRYDDLRREAIARILSDRARKPRR